MTSLTTQPFIPQGLNTSLLECGNPQLAACCVLPLIPLRAQPSERAEQVTQVLHGQYMVVLTQQDAWSLVRVLDDGYEGWCASKMLHFLSLEEARSAFGAPRVLTVAPLSLCETGDGHAYLPAGSRLLPNERVVSPPVEVAFNPVALALCFLQAPYLWGGKTILGMDCSGLVQVVHVLCGVLLPRDASQQVLLGTRVDKLDQAMVGDLAFFHNEAGAVVHVGLLMENRRIVHASGRVRVDRWDEQGIFNENLGLFTHQRPLIRRL